MINFEKNKVLQSFSFPYTVIKYITAYGNSKLSRNLMKTCKYLRFMQINFGFCHINSLEVETRWTKIVLNITPCWWTNTFYIDGHFQLKTPFKAVKVWDHLEIQGCINGPHSENIRNFLPKIDFSQISSIIIYNFFRFGYVK